MKNTSEKSLRGLMPNCTAYSKWEQEIQKIKAPFWRSFW
jgi:hypothetical protein